MGFCECTNRDVCDPHRCRFIDKGKRCRSPRLWKSEGCTKHTSKMPRIDDSVNGEDFPVQIGFAL